MRKAEEQNASCTYSNAKIGLGNHPIDFFITTEPRPEIEKSLRTLNNNDKWVLSTRTIINDNLYDFGKSRIGDYSS
jgi:hypothetical protein